MKDALGYTIKVMPPYLCDYEDMTYVIKEEDTGAYHCVRVSEARLQEILGHLVGEASEVDRRLNEALFSPLAR